VLREEPPLLVFFNTLSCGHFVYKRVGAIILDSLYTMERRIVRRLGRILLLIVMFLLLLLLVGPLIIPVPPLKGTVPAEQLADPDSLFVAVDGLTVHYKRAGQGEPVFILLHGFGASLFSWREVMAPLSQFGTVIAFDRPAFGLTERPMPGQWQGENPYSAEAQVRLTLALMDKLDVPQAILVGNSAGGTIAMLAALRAPERVQALILVSPAVYGGGGAPSWIRLLSGLPQVRRVGPLLVRSLVAQLEASLPSAWHDPGKITPEVWAGYKKPLQVENWDRAFWEFTLAGRSQDLEQQLDRFTLPALVVTGDDDRWVPTAQSVRLSEELPNARLALIPNCGHVSHEECPQQFMAAVTSFMEEQ
jgi:pimeloyl-ACP methyl ester carboxylesterase